MRRKDRMISEEEALALLDKCEYGTLSMVTPDNKPYSIPVNYLYCSENGNVIYVHCAKKGKKIDCLTTNVNVQFTAVGATKSVTEGYDSFTSLYESTMAFGTASFVEDEALKNKVLLELCIKHWPEIKEGTEAYSTTVSHIEKFGKFTAVIKIDVSEISGKSNKGEK